MPYDKYVKLQGYDRFVSYLLGKSDDFTTQLFVLIRMAQKDEVNLNKLRHAYPLECRAVYVYYEMGDEELLRRCSPEAQKQYWEMFPNTIGMPVNDPRND